MTAGQITIVVYKHDVATSLANALMALGKNDHEATRYHIEQAGRNHEEWLKQRPERKLAQARTTSFTGMGKILSDDEVARDYGDRPPHEWGTDRPPGG